MHQNAISSDLSPPQTLPPAPFPTSTPHSHQAFWIRPYVPRIPARITPLIITSSDSSLTPLSFTNCSPSDHFHVFTELSINLTSLTSPTLLLPPAPLYKYWLFSHWPDWHPLRLCAVCSRYNASEWSLGWSSVRRCVSSTLSRLSWSSSCASLRDVMQLATRPGAHQSTWPGERSAVAGVTSWAVHWAPISTRIQRWHNRARTTDTSPSWRQQHREQR